MFGAFFISKNHSVAKSEPSYSKPRRPSKTLLTIDERGSKISRNSVFESMLVDSIRFRLSPIQCDIKGNKYEQNHPRFRFFYWSWMLVDEWMLLENSVKLFDTVSRHDTHVRHDTHSVRLPTHLGRKDTRALWQRIHPVGKLIHTERP